MYIFIIIGSIALVSLLFIITAALTRHMHHRLLIWKYFDVLAKLRGDRHKIFQGKLGKQKKEELRYYVMSCLLWHYPKEQIKSACLEVGWDERAVDDTISSQEKILLKENK